MISKKTVDSSPFVQLQEFLVASGASAIASNQEKADWVDAYVD